MATIGAVRFVDNQLAALKCEKCRKYVGFGDDWFLAELWDSKYPLAAVICRDCFSHVNLREGAEWEIEDG